MSDRPPLRARLTALSRRPDARRALFAVLLGVGASLYAGVLRNKNLPLDDSYIHLSYGIDFDPRTIFSFQAGRRDTGTSSWLWTAICILVVKLRLPEHFTLTTLGVLTLCANLWLIMEIVARVLPADLPLRRVVPYASALLMAGSGNVIWLSLSGMETGLSVLLLLWGVPRLLSPRGITFAHGLIALAMVWTRIESLVWLTLVALALPFVRRDGRERRALRGLVLPLAGLALYVAYNLAVCGHLMPTTALSKRATFVPGGHVWKDEVEFVLALGRNYFRHHLPGFLVEIAACLSAGLFLLIHGLVGLGKRRFRGRPTLPPEALALAVLALGAFGHAALNVVEFRSAYHHMRYFAPILYLVPAFALPLTLLSIWPLLRRLSRFRGAAFSAMAAHGLSAGVGALVVGASLSHDLPLTRLWISLYRKNAEQLGAVHLAVGRYLREQAPPGTRRVASFDIGALRWASRLEIIDLAGTSDARALDYRVRRKQADLVRDTHADVYVSIENGYDYIPQNQPTYDIEMLRSFQYPEYLDPYPPHSRRMVLYRVHHCGEPAVRRVNVGPLLSFEFGSGDVRARAAGVASGDSFSRWPVTAKDLGHAVHLARGRFLASDAHPLRDRAMGRFETTPMEAKADWLSFRMAGGHDPKQLRIELRSEGRTLTTWTGFNSDAFLEIVHPISELRGQRFTLLVIDEAKGHYGHLLLDEVQQFDWREQPARACSAKR